MGKGGVALEHRRVVLLQDPRKPANWAPMLESVSRLGAGMPDSDAGRKKIAESMSVLRRRCTGLIDKLVYLHSLRYGEGYYTANDPELKEQDRMNFLICYSIYISTRMEKANSRALELDDTGNSALFHVALKEVNRFFGRGFCRLSAAELVRRFADIEPLINASLASSGLEGLIIPNVRIFDETKPEALNRINATLDRIYGPEEAA